MPHMSDLAYADAKVYKDGDGVGLTVDCAYAHEGSTALVDYDNVDDVLTEIERVRNLPPAGGATDGSLYARFSWEPDPLVPGKFLFRARYEDNLTYTWRWGDGHDLTPGEGGDPWDNHVYDSEGSFDVSLIVTRNIDGVVTTLSAYGRITVKTANPAHGSG